MTNDRQDRQARLDRVTPQQRAWAQMFIDQRRTDGMTLRELAAKLTDLSGEHISPSRLSDAQHGVVSARVADIVALYYGASFGSAAHDLPHFPLIHRHNRPAQNGDHKGPLLDGRIGLVGLLRAGRAGGRKGADGDLLAVVVLPAFPELRIEVWG